LFAVFVVLNVVGCVVIVVFCVVNFRGREELLFLVALVRPARAAVTS
jgi:hypothetical protein